MAVLSAMWEEDGTEKMIDGWRLYNWLCDWQYADFVDLQNGTKGREKENAVLEEVIQMVLEMIKEGE